MTNTNTERNSTTNKMRWSARGISTAWLAVTLIWVIGGYLTEIKRGYAEFSFAHGGEILFLVLVGILIILLGWWREIVGGIILIISASGFLVAFLIAAEFSLSVLLKGLLICIPFVLSGLLYLLCWRQMKKQDII